MEGAGHALAEIIRENDSQSILFLCGSGNNGGDGMVAARHLADEREITVCYHSGNNPSPAHVHQLRSLVNSSVRLCEIKCPHDAMAMEQTFSHTDLIVDALLGIGAYGVLREPYLSLVNLANASKKPIFSADVPTPGIIPTSICAFHRKKTEDAIVVDIGIPILAEICTGLGDLQLIPERKSSDHKGAGGCILIIGGGPYQGAPFLAGMAALRSGADIVRVASPSMMPFPDLIHEPLQGLRITEEHIDSLMHLCEKADVVVCGMGLGSDSHQVVSAIAPSCQKAVFDADALRQPLPISSDTIYTPHAGEFTRITGIVPSNNPLDRADQIIDAHISGTVLLKGPVDVISDGVKTKFNRTGTPAMTTGGTGDVLAGVCGALFAVLPAFDAACISAYATGRAGEMVAENMGYGLIAQDLMHIIPQILYQQTMSEET
jgi:NAD(P)H-hydrate epimerase